MVIPAVGAAGICAPAFFTGLGEAIPEDYGTSAKGTVLHVAWLSLMKNAGYFHA